MIATQLYLGAHEAAAFPMARVESAIGAAKETAGITAIMIWPCAEMAETERLVQACRARGIEPYLWFPVLADAPGVPARQEDLVVMFDGQKGNGRTGAWDGLGTGDETFLFSCPNNAPFMDRVFAAYALLLDRLEVRGVMLDRIRFPSPANGFEALFTCFCPSCAERFQSETGQALSLQAQRAASFLQRMKNLTASRFSSEWRAADSLWSVSGLAELSAFRRRSIARVVERFSQEAHRRGLKVGLDLFSPSLSRVVSQDYLALARHCDWIKPMIYCHAHGPAGLPLEWESLRSALQRFCPGLAEGEAASIAAAALRVRMRDGRFPADTISRELDLIDGMQLPPNVDVLPGVEAVRIPAFGIDISEEMLGEALCRLEGRCAGFVASWNLLHIPEANLRRLGAGKR